MRKLKKSTLLFTVYLSVMCMLSGCGLKGKKAEETTEAPVQYEVIETASDLDLDALKDSAKFFESNNDVNDKNMPKIKKNPDLDGELSETQERVIERTTVYSDASKTSSILGYIEMDNMVTVLKRDVKEGWTLIAFQGRACYVDSAVFEVVEEATDTDIVQNNDNENDPTNNDTQNTPDKKKDNDKETNKKEETQKPSKNDHNSSDEESSDSGSGSSVSDGSDGSSGGSSGDSSGNSGSSAPEKSDDKVSSRDDTPEKSDDKVTSSGSDTSKTEEKASE